MFEEMEILNKPEWPLNGGHKSALMQHVLLMWTSKHRRIYFTPSIFLGV